MRTVAATFIGHSYKVHYSAWGECGFYRGYEIGAPYCGITGRTLLGHCPDHENPKPSSSFINKIIDPL